MLKQPDKQKRSSGCSRDRAAPVVFLRKKCALLSGISHVALEECARSGNQPWADGVIAKAFAPAIFHKQLATGKLLASSKLDLSLVLEQIASQVLWLEFFT